MRKLRQAVPALMLLAVAAGGVFSSARAAQGQSVLERDSEPRRWLDRRRGHRLLQLPPPLLEGGDDQQQGPQLADVLLGRSTARTHARRRRLLEQLARGRWRAQ